jgi:hypothetical protein
MDSTTITVRNGKDEEEGQLPLLDIDTYSPMKMEQTQCFETSAFKLQTAGNNPEKSIQHSSSPL